MNPLRTAVNVPDGVHVPAPRTDVTHPWSRAFENMRRRRRGRQLAAPSAGRRRAAITMVRDEPVFLPIWLDYYSRFFGPEDLYVLDHGTSDGSTSGDGFVRIPVSHETVDHAWMVRTIEGYQHELMESYDVVVVTDVDEIVAPRPELGSLGEYIDRLDEDYVNCIGYELIHMVDREGPFDPGAKVLDQRGYWFANHVYNKPAIAMMRMRWAPGFHQTKDIRVSPDPDLYMVHLHRMDYEICLARHRYRESRSWNGRDLERGWARHNLIADEAEFGRWFYDERITELTKMVIEPIPDEWRGLF